MTHSRKGFFSSDFYTDNLINYLEERRPEETEKPFFAYLPFSAPHWPLQCAKEDRKRYEGIYDDGPEALRLRRLANLQKLGLVPKDVKAHDVVAGPMNLEWEQMTPYERKCSARAMECFAGMIDNIDQNVGKIVEFLKKTKEFESMCCILPAAVELLALTGHKSAQTLSSSFKATTVLKVLTMRRYPLWAPILCGYSRLTVLASSPRRSTFH